MAALNNQQLTDRVLDIETAIKELATAVNSLATKTQLKQLLLIRQSQLDEMQNQIENFELTGIGPALNAHKVDASAHPEINNRFVQKAELINSSAGAADAGKVPKLNASGQIDPTMYTTGNDVPAVSGTDGFVLNELAGTYNFRAVEDTEIVGGFAIVVDTATRDAINAAFRKEGMIIQVLGGGAYILDGGITNSDWKLITPGSSRVLENLTITVDPVSGTDPAGAVFLTQNMVTSHGSVANIQQAFKALPDNINGYLVTISLVDGDHSIDNPAYDFAADAGRFVFGGANFSSFTESGIKIVSANGLVIAPGTTTMAVSTSANTIVTLTSDPGLAVDQLYGMWIKANGGASNGTIRPCRGNNGTEIDLIRNISVPTSVNAVVPAARIVSAAGFLKLELNAQGQLFVPTYNGAIIFEAVDIVNTGGSGFPEFDIGGMSNITFQGGTRVIGWNLSVKQAEVYLGNVIFDGDSNANVFTGAYIYGNAQLKSINSQLTWGFLDYLGDQAVLLDAQSSGRAFASLFGGGFDAIAGAALVTRGFGSTIHSYDNLEFWDTNICVNADVGGKFILPAISSDISRFNSGNTFDYIVDGVAGTWAELLAAPELRRQGHWGSIIGSATETTALTGTPALTGHGVLQYFQEGLKIPTTLTPAGTAQTIDWHDGQIQNLDLGSATGNVTLTLSNPLEGATYRLYVRNNGNNRSLVWPAAVKWAGDLEPTVTGGAAAITEFELVYDGTDYHAHRVGQDVPEESGNDGYSLIEISGIAAWRALKESYLVPLFDITSFALGTSVVEIGQSIVTPSFTAAYNRTPTTATLTDDEASPPKDVTATPTAFSSDGTFQKTANNDSILFTLTAIEDGENDTGQATLSWRPRTYYGVDVDGLSTEADIEALATSQLDNNRNITFTVNPGAGEHIYYAYPASYGAATFTIGGFEGGFTLVSDAISVTNAHGVTQNYRLYKSVNPNLGSTTVVVT